MKWSPINNMGDCPKTPGEYLVTADPEGLHVRFVGMDYWNGHRWRHASVDMDYWNGHRWRHASNVIAWMELPEPYEAPRATAPG